MRDHNCFAVGTGNNGGDDIAKLEFDFSIRVIFAALLDYVIVQPARFCRSRSERNEAVAPVDIEVGRDRSDPMRRIKLAVAFESDSS